jgi:hypothetical protein
MRVLDLFANRRHDDPRAIARRLSEAWARRSEKPPRALARVPKLVGTLRKTRGVVALWEAMHRIQGKVVELAFASDVGQHGALCRRDRADAVLDETVLATMRRAAKLVLKHPVAAQAAFAALVAEGQAFARTDEGARMDAALRRSPAIERSFRAFEMLTGNVLLENPDVVLPSGYIDLLVQTAEIHDLGPYFARLLEREER